MNRTNKNNQQTLGLFTYQSSTVGDAVGDTRSSNSSGILLNEICTVSNAVKGSGAWVDARSYAGMYAYNKSIPFNITVADTYHALHLVTAGDIVAGLLSNWTFNAGRTVDTNITSEASGTGGKLRIICSGVHSLTTGDLVVLGNMNNAGHNKPTRITLDGTNPTTEFLCDDITYVAGAGASAGKVDEPAYLKAGAGSAGIYHASFTLDGTAAQINKDWKWELNVNITGQDNMVTERNSTNTLASMSAIGNMQIAENDKVWLSAKNITDTSDYIIKNMNINLHKI